MLALLKALALSSALSATEALCPYANLWMKYGPDDATKILEHLRDKKMATRRRLIESHGNMKVYAKCEYVNPFANMKTCVHLEGDEWNAQNSKAHCDKMMGGMAKGTLSVGEECVDVMNKPNFGGYCIVEVDGGTEASLMTLGGMSPTCEALETSCSTWSRGTFKMAGKCAPKAATNGNHVDIGYGACNYQEPFGKTDQCVQLSGDGWSSTNAASYCNSVMDGMAQGTVAAGEQCKLFSDAKYGGYCLVNEGPMSEMMPMVMSPPMMGTCEAMESSCKMWYKGTFVKGGICGGETNGNSYVNGETNGNSYVNGETNGSDTNGHSMSYSDEDDVKKAAPAERCTIAPGPMGGAHQMAGSVGYAVDCEDAPAKNSPYQWPLRWAVRQKTNSFYADKRGEGYNTVTDVYYDLSKNYKRSDTVEFSGSMAQMEWFDYEDVTKQTILHRNNEMVFITSYKNETQTCSKMDLGVVGNIRPDWFLDDRGTLTSAQYIGNEHVYYQNKPTLVKKWRKKDFADMYFVMSMAAEPDPENDNVHWPLIRNDPGEGIGPDALHEYSNHRLLTDDDDYLFHIDKDMDCPVVTSGSSDFSDFMKEEIPSNLNVPEAGWFNLVWTGSPDGPALPPNLEDELCDAGAGSSTGETKELPGMAPLDGSDGTLHYCHNGDNVHIKLSFATPEPVWAAVGVRPGEICRMTPANVGIVHEEAVGNGMDYYFGDLPGSLRMSTSALLEVKEEDMADPNEIESVSHSFVDGVMTFEFMRSLEGLGLDSSTKTIPISWAIGNSSVMGYHKVRSCMILEDVPNCSDVNFNDVTTGTAGEEHSSAHNEECALDEVNEKISDLQKSMNMLLCGQQNNQETCLSIDGCKWNDEYQSCSM